MTLAKSDTSTFTPTDLMGGEADIVTTGGTVASGNDVAKHTVLGRVAADGKYVPWAPGAADGSEVAVAIAAEAIDASAADAEGPLYVGGYFNPDELVWVNGTAAQQAVAFDGTAIFLRKPLWSGE